MDLDNEENEADGAGLRINRYELKDIFNARISKKAPDQIIGNDINSSNLSSGNQVEILDPPYDLDFLAEMKNLSESLQACIEAYSVNISGFGYEFLEEKPTYLKDGKRYYKEDHSEVDPQTVLEMNEELSRLKMFFESVSLDRTWTTLQSLKMNSKYSTGNAYYEVERGGANQLQGFIYVEPQNIRLTKRQPELIKIDQFVKNPQTLEYVINERGKYFRQFIQQDSSGKRIYFKEFGDPRIMNALTGKYYKDSKGKFINQKNIPKSFFTQRKKDGEDFVTATELMHFKIPAINDADGYGYIIHINLVPVLLGVSYSDLSDYHTLENKGIPEAMVIIEGAKAKNLVNEIEDILKNNKKLRNYQSLLFVGAEGVNSGTNVNPSYKNPSIRIEPLNLILSKEGLKGKTEYIEKVNERVATAFRLPTFFFGKLDNVNRSVAEFAIDLVNKQVFRPKIVEEDADINKFIMTELRAKYYRYASTMGRMENPEIITQNLKDGIQLGSILPSEARPKYSDILGIPLDNISNDFMNTPYPEALGKNENKTAKLFKLSETKDSEVLTKIKKRIEDEFSIQLNDGVYLWSK